MAGFRTAKARKIWNDLPVGGTITALKLIAKLPDPHEVKVSRMYRSSVSSYLSRRISRKQAVHSGRIGRFDIYKKLKDDTGRAKEKRVSSTAKLPDFNELQLGRSVLAIIEDLKAKLKMEKETVRDMVHKMKELEKLYRTAQQKILELNQADRPKSFKLDELQNVINGKQT